MEFKGAAATLAQDGLHQINQVRFYCAPVVLDNTPRNFTRRHVLSWRCEAQDSSQAEEQEKYR